MKLAKRRRPKGEISKRLLYLSVFALLLFIPVNSDVVGEYGAALSLHQGDIEELAAELSGSDYEVTGLVTLEFKIAGDGSADVRLIGSTVAYPKFNEALMAEAELWQLQPHGKAEVIIYKQFVIGNKLCKSLGKIVINDPIPGAKAYSVSAEKVAAEMGELLNQWTTGITYIYGDIPTTEVSLFFCYISEATGTFRASRPSIPRYRITYFVAR